MILINIIYCCVHTIEALNDARMDEVAISDYLMRLSASQRFSRLILDVLTEARPAE